MQALESARPAQRRQAQQLKPLWGEATARWEINLYHANIFLNR
jgi:hypothetical protein